MNYLQSFKRVQKFLLVNNLWAAILLAGVMLSGCDRAPNSGPANSGLTSNGVPVDSLLAKKLGTSNFIKVQGRFVTKDFTEYAVCSETRAKANAGVLFQIFGLRGDTLSILYNSPLLDGALKHATFSTVESTDSVFKLLYYDSGDFFMGNSSGEVYSYVLNPRTRFLTRGHLFMTQDLTPRLYISSGVTNDLEKKYLLNKMKEVYPNLKTVVKDKTID